MSTSETEHDLIGSLVYFFIFKFRSNFIGTEFILYSNGLSYKNSNDLKNLRKELAFIQYEYQILKTRSNIKLSIFLGNLFTVYIPSLTKG